jgi:hypothetical protein
MTSAGRATSPVRPGPGVRRPHRATPGGSGSSGRGTPPRHVDLLPLDDPSFPRATGRRRRRRRIDGTPPARGTTSGPPSAYRRKVARKVRQHPAGRTGLRRLP